MSGVRGTGGYEFQWLSDAQWEACRRAGDVNIEALECPWNDSVCDEGYCTNEFHRKADPVRVHVEFDGEIESDNGRWLVVKVKNRNHDTASTHFYVDTEDEAFKVTPIKPVKTGHPGEVWQVVHDHASSGRWFCYYLGSGVGFKSTNGTILGHDSFFAKFPDAVCIL